MHGFLFLKVKKVDKKVKIEKKLTKEKKRLHDTIHTAKRGNSNKESRLGNSIETRRERDGFQK